MNEKYSDKVSLDEFPQFVYEKEIDRHERSEKRKLWIIVLLIVLLFASNIVWLCVFNSYDTIAYTQDGEGINSVNIGEQGDLINEPGGDYTKKAETQN